jgi:formate transporter
MNNDAFFDAPLPPAMAQKAEELGVRKVNLPVSSMFLLAVLAGAFMALGGIFATTVCAGSSQLPYGVVRLLMGLVFSLGLILIVVGGAELFTSNNLIVMAFSSGKVSIGQLLLNWLWSTWAILPGRRPQRCSCS